MFVIVFDARRNLNSEAEQARIALLRHKKKSELASMNKSWRVSDIFLNFRFISCTLQHLLI